MRNLKLLFVAISLVLITSCDSDKDDILSTDAQVNELRILMQNNTWHVSNFVKNNNDLTADYTDYAFNFDENNVLRAVSEDTEIDGTWRVSNNSGSQTDSYFDVDFNIFFSPEGKFGQLAGDYMVISANAETINLQLGENLTGNEALLSFSKS